MSIIWIIDGGLGDAFSSTMTCGAHTVNCDWLWLRRNFFTSSSSYFFRLRKCEKVPHLRWFYYIIRELSKEQKGAVLLSSFMDLECVFLSYFMEANMILQREGNKIWKFKLFTLFIDFHYQFIIKNCFPSFFPNIYILFENLLLTWKFITSKFSYFLFICSQKRSHTHSLKST